MQHISECAVKGFISLGEDRVVTGFRSLDAILGPLSGGNVVVIAVRPDVDRDGLVLQLLTNAVRSLRWKNRARVAGFWWSSSSRPDARHAALSVDEIESRIPFDTRLVVIESLESVVGWRDESGPFNVMRGLKWMARGLKVPVLCFARLPEAGGLPSLDLLDDEISMFANSVVLVHRVRADAGPSAQDPATENTVRLHVAKRWNGPTGVARLRYRGDHLEDCCQAT